MKITGLTVWALELPMRNAYALSGGRHFDRLDSTIVRLDTDEGLIGWGEGCPWGSTYLPAYARGIRAGIDELAPVVLGSDPRRPEVMHRTLDAALPGHPYVKSSIDMACWDIAAQAAGLPLCDLLGGRAEGRVRLHSSISCGTPEQQMDLIDEARARGYHFHSAKLGAGVDRDVEAMRFLDVRMEDGEEVTFDVNRGWLPAEAIAALNITSDLTRVVEQPCETLAQHLHVRRHVSQPLAVDESMHTLGDMLWIVETGAAEVVGVKLGRVGGLTVARRIRDVCVEAGIRMNIEDTGGTSLQATAAVHLAQATPEPIRRATWLCVEHLTRDPVEGGARNHGDGWTAAPDGPGLGAIPDEGALGDPWATYR